MYVPPAVPTSHSPHTMRGMSFMDVIVGTALVLIIFTALVGLLQSSLKLASLVKVQELATTIAEGQMEYVRSLSYDSVGTVGGIPAGNIPQNQTITQNGISFPVRTYIQYQDDPADGLGSADTNGITTDYKQIKITVTYSVGNTSNTITLVSNYAPKGIETTNGGGTLQINVVNAAGAGVPGASVRIVNASRSPTIDVTTFSDVQGTVFLPGAPTSTQYQIFVSKSGYSSAQTYARDTNNQNPTPGYLTVVKNQTTTGTFAIDVLASLNVGTFLPIATSTFTDSFTSMSKIGSSNNVNIGSGAVVLTTDANGYVPSGNVRSSSSTPAYLNQWGVATIVGTTPSGTGLRFHIVDGSGTPLPDTVLPGNASGFTSSVNLYGISTSTYPTLALSADLSTTATSSTPQLQNWSLSYAQGPIPTGNINFSLTGAKTIGSTGAGAPITKTTVATSTNSSGTVPLSLEWDSYSLGLPGYDALDICTAPPYALSPGSSLNTSIIIASSTSNMMLVSVTGSGGAIGGAAVTLSKSGYTNTVNTSSCGGAYFGSLTSGTYSLSVVKSGYTTVNASNVSVSGHVFYQMSLGQ